MGFVSGVVAAIWFAHRKQWKEAVIAVLIGTNCITIFGYVVESHASAIRGARIEAAERLMGEWGTAKKEVSEQ